MGDGVKIVAIGTVGIVTILSFVLLPADAALHNNLVYGLLSLVGVHVVGAGVMAIRGWKGSKDAKKDG